MANIKISDLTAASVAADANEFEINEAGTSKKVTGSQIKAYVNAADGALASKNTVATADIDNLAVTTAKLAADAVDGTKIADDAIGNEHIATGAVNADSIASNAVGADELNVTGNGTAGQYLASDGDGTMTWTTLAVAAGGFSNMQAFTAPGTWTNPGNITKVKVTVTGGGGAGAYGVAAATYVSGGGAGGTAIEVIPFPSATNVTVTVGAAGTNPGFVSGNAGGTSSFGAYCSATGGGGGVSAPGNNIINLAEGGTGSGGTLNINGGDAHALSVQTRVGAAGGSSYWGGQRGKGGNTGKGAYGAGGMGTLESPLPGTPSGGMAHGVAGVVVVEF